MKLHTWWLRQRTSDYVQNVAMQWHIKLHTKQVSRLASNWILMSCQPRMVTSEQSNPVTYKHRYISKLFSYVNPFSTQIYKSSPYTTRKQNIHKHWNTNFQINKSIRHIRLGHAGIINHSVWFINSTVKKSIKREWTETMRTLSTTFTNNEDVY